MLRRKFISTQIEPNIPYSRKDSLLGTYMLSNKKNDIHDWITSQIKKASVIHFAWQFTRWSTASGGTNLVGAILQPQGTRQSFPVPAPRIEEDVALQRRSQVLLYPFRQPED